VLAKLNPLPPEGSMSYRLYLRLTGPAVERFGFAPRVFDYLTRHSSDEEVLELIGDLNQIEAGFLEAEEDKREAEKSKK
jgi:hypothetical protein